MTPLERAISEAGGIDLFRKFFTNAKGKAISRHAVEKWGKRIPAERVLLIEKATGVSRHDLRPDLYPREEKVA